MSVSPTLDLARRSSKQRIAPLIEECPRLRDKVKDHKSRDSGNTILMKEFPGGLLILSGANSSPGLRSLPCRFIFADEIDAYVKDCDGEGDPITLVEARARTFSRRKIFLVSTPTIAGRSNIEAEFDLTDKRYFYLPCPRCGEMQTLKWAQVKWEKDAPLDAWYQCEECQGKIENWEKTKMLEAGEWRATVKDTNPRTAGFHLSSLYSPVGWFGWGDIANEWIKSKSIPEKLRGFINTVLGETWKDRGEAPDWKRLYERRQTYKIGTLPEGVLFITSGADIQKDRIEVEIVGWCRDKVSYSIDYRVFMGDTSSINSASWRQLTDLVYETFTSASGLEVPIKMLGVDSGYNTQIVYAWARQFQITKVATLKGIETQSTAIGIPRAVDVTSRGKRYRRGLKVFTIGVNMIKAELYGWLRQPSPDEGQPDPHGYCYFPEYGEEYFKQLTAEEMVAKTVRGYKRYQWIKTRDRNEVLDCRVMSRAVATICGMDRYKDEHWRKLEMELGVKTPEKSDDIMKSKGKKVTIKRKRSSYL